jgi:hypothetical protein
MCTATGWQPSCLCVNVYCHRVTTQLFVCKCVLPPGDNSTAVNIYILLLLLLLLLCDAERHLRTSRNTCVGNSVGCATAWHTVRNFVVSPLRSQNTNLIAVALPVLKTSSSIINRTVLQNGPCLVWNSTTFLLTGLFCRTVCYENQLFF